jgi:hypothetical protein
LALAPVLGRTARTLHNGLTARTPPLRHLFTGQDQCVHCAVLQPDDRNGSVGIYYGMVGVTSAWALLQLVDTLLRFLLSSDGLVTGPALFFIRSVAW